MFSNSFKALRKLMVTAYFSGFNNLRMLTTIDAITSVCFSMKIKKSGTAKKPN